MKRIALTILISALTQSAFGWGENAQSLQDLWSGYEQSDAKAERKSREDRRDELLEEQARLLRQNQQRTCVIKRNAFGKLEEECW